MARPGTPQYSVTIDTLASRWDTLETAPAALEAITAVAQQLINNKTRYQTVQSVVVVVPWFMVAVLHYRENGIDFSLQLMTGDPITEASTHYPIGRGPYATWEDSAVDALRFVGLDTIPSENWTWERMLYELAVYDTAAYVQRGVPSPFLWAFSNHYQRGMVTDNNTFEPQTIDAQFGCGPILKAMQAIDATITLPREASP